MKRNLYKIWYAGICLLFACNAFAQIKPAADFKIDSLRKIIHTQIEDTNKINSLDRLTAIFTNNNDYQNAEQTANEAIALSQKINFKKGIAAAYYNRVMAHIMSGENHPEDLNSIDIALKTNQETGDKKGIEECFNAISDIYYARGNYPEAIKYMYAALKVNEEMGDKTAVINSLLNIASVNSSQENDSDALKNYLGALQMSKDIHDTNNIAISSTGVGETYYKVGDFDKALNNEYTALQLFKKLNGYSSRWGIPLSYKLIGEINEKQGELEAIKGDKMAALAKFNEALNNLRAALTAYEKDSNKAGIADANLNLARVYVKLNKIAVARIYLQKSLQFYKANGGKEGLKDNYENLSALDSLQGNYREAYQNYRQYILYRDSLNNEATAKRSLMYQMQYDFDKKEAIAKAAQDKKDMEAKRVRNQQYFAIAALGVLVLAVVIIALIQLKNNKQKQKANLLLERQKQKVEATLTELKSTQAQLIHSEKMASLGELTAGIAHEIQNPLNFVNNFSEVSNELMDEIKDGLKKGNYEEVNAMADDVKQNMEKINHHGKRADAIVKGMLQHSRRSSGQKEPTDINDLCDEYLRLSYHGLRAKNKSFNADLKTDFDNSISKINIVPQDIGRVLLNLFNNAFYAVDEKQKAMSLQQSEYKPMVSVQTKKLDNTVEIRIEDNGNGIPQNIIDKIFQPFFTTKPTGQGTGLGLSLSYDIIKSHGGEIKAYTKENEARPDDPVGQGTEFIIELPVK